MNLCPPPEGPGRGIDAEHVWTRHCRRAFDDTNYERVAGERRTGAGVITGVPRIVRHFVRPDHGAALRVELPHRTAEVAEVHRSTGDGRRAGHVARGGGHPFQVELFRGVGRDLVLERLAAAVRRIVTDHSPGG